MTMESSRPNELARRRTSQVLTPLALATPPMPAEQDVASVLRRLVAVCHESESGLRAASRAATLPCFRTMLAKLSRQRGQLAAELQIELAKMDEELDHSGPVATGARGVWSDVLIAGDEGSLLFACERAEETTIRAFEESRRRGLPAHVDAVIQRSADLVLDGVDHLQRVRRH